ncbi:MULTISPECIES: hypothetical protein [Enterococcus]|uniref:hypothetical protein n=1 Tax=Enterococcus TaxID=1350 RepID=UPI0001B2E0CE|nr:MULTISPECIES: hypothetical protein [Enterococcus]EEU75554.1 conserved hypothetical protein [Enterococcus faecalis JH1]EOI86574.1 hypothetical protein UM9_03226 [Enterococcus faecalis EnGen0298]MBD9751719.1 hypothetical protein [Enterococcus faecium]TKN38453.1 hypothetical protein DVW97_06305 [Enterococcus faecium]TKN56340.1 hypothetical protein DVX18_05015 [Enterococcus faecium]
MLNRKSATITIFVLIVSVFALSIGLNIKQELTVKTANSKIAALEKKNDILKRETKDQKSRISKLEDENNKMIETQIVNKDGDVYKEFTDIATKYFKSRFNYDPKTYKESKENVRNLISEELYKKFSENQLTYGDSNNVSSRLDNLEIYSGSLINQKTITGLLIVDYESKLGETDWFKNSEIYTVQYDIHAKKLTKIQSLGSVLRGDMIE